jgi:hypothetical protein
VQPGLLLLGPGFNVEAQRGLARGHFALIMKVPAAPPAPREADSWTLYAMSLEWLLGYCQQAGDPEAVCCIAKILVDPGTTS